MTMFLERANADVACFCDCDRSRLAPGVPLDCPWCGCGWMFACLACHRGVTFARGVEVPESYEELADRYVRMGLGRAPTAPEAREVADFLRRSMAGVEAGKLYVTLDQAVIPADATGVRGTGTIGRHELDYVPHVRARTEPAELARTLQHVPYWYKARFEKERRAAQVGHVAPRD